MLHVGLTGGIGSGKSTVADLLAARGAVVVDADVAARRVVEPGRPAYHAIVGRFGPGVVAADGTLDRAALARRVFADSAARADLEAITHPAIAATMTEHLAAHAGTGAVVVSVIPLLVERDGPRPAMAAVIVVDCPVEVALARLVDRGMALEDAEARIAAQASRHDRLAHADFVVDNGGDLLHLEGEVERCWRWMGQIEQTA